MSLIDELRSAAKTGTESIINSAYERLIKSCRLAARFGKYEFVEWKSTYNEIFVRTQLTSMLKKEGFKVKFMDGGRGSSDTGISISWR